MTVEVDPRVRRFVRGQLGGDELLEFERDLDARPELREQVARLSDTLDAAEAGPGAGSLAHRELHLGALLGRGGMANVYAAWQPHLGREVAVKTLRTVTADSRERLIQEARLTGWLEHPSVVPVHDLLEDGDELRVVMKRIEGQPWSRLIVLPDEVRARFEAEPLEWHVTVAIAICRALQFAHERGVIHRDIKPSNVMVGRLGDVYLLDWGVAGTLERGAVEQLPCVRDGACAGTPAYMAPEQLTPEGPLDERTDVYLVGGCLFEVLEGRPPFSRATLESRLERRAEAPRPSTSEPAELAGIVRRALSTAPDERPASVADLRRALEGFLRHRDAGRLAASAGARADQAGAAWAKGNAVEGDRLAIEAEFGFRAALELWPEDGATRALLEALQARRVRVVVERGEAHTASWLLTGVLQPPEQLVSEVEAAVKAADTERLRLEALAVARDRRVGLRAKRTMLGLFAVGWFSTWTAVAWSPPQTSAVLGWYLAAVSAAATAGAMRWRRELLAHSRNREMMLVQAAMLAASLGLTFAAGPLGLGVSQAVVLLMLVWALGMAAVAVIIEPTSGLPAVVWGLCFVLAVALPEAWRPALAVGAAVHGLLPLLVSFRVPSP